MRRLVASSWSVVIGAFLRRIGRAHRGLRGDEGGGRTGPAPAAQRRAEASAEDGEGPAILPRDVKAGAAADGK